MKKIVLIILAICMLFSTTYAHNLTKVINGSRLITSMREGESATIRYNDTEGCTFKNWTAEGMVLSNPSSKTITITMSANDVTITANVEVSSYTITYSLNGGTASNPESYTIRSNTISLNAPIKSGYIFSGWTGSNGEIPQKNVTIPKGSRGNRVYTANWENGVYTIITKADEGAEIEGVYTNKMCTLCGGKNHECDVVNIKIKANNAEVTEQ